MSAWQPNPAKILTDAWGSAQDFDSGENSEKKKERRKERQKDRKLEGREEGRKKERKEGRSEVATMVGNSFVIAVWCLVVAAAIDSVSGFLL